MSTMMCLDCGQESVKECVNGTSDKSDGHIYMDSH